MPRCRNRDSRSSSGTPSSHTWTRPSAPARTACSASASLAAWTRACLPRACAARMRAAIAARSSVGHLFPYALAVVDHDLDVVGTFGDARVHVRIRVGPLRQHRRRAANACAPVAARHRDSGTGRPQIRALRSQAGRLLAAHLCRELRQRVHVELCRDAERERGLERRRHTSVGVSVDQPRKERASGRVDDACAGGNRGIRRHRVDGAVDHDDGRARQHPLAVEDPRVADGERVPGDRLRRRHGSRERDRRHEKPAGPNDVSIDGMTVSRRRL